jgi:hypothetical protein
MSEFRLILLRVRSLQAPPLSLSVLAANAGPRVPSGGVVVLTDLQSSI